MSLIVFALQRLSCPSMDSRFDSMHVQACIPVTRHAMLVHSRISLLGPVAHACHSHECSSRFFVMHVHRTYTSIRGTHKHQSLLHVCIVPCSSVLVVLRFLFQHPLGPVQTYLNVLRSKPIWLFSVPNLSHNKSVSEFTNIRYSPYGILALLVVFCFFAARIHSPRFQAFGMDSI